MFLACFLLFSFAPLACFPWQEGPKGLAVEEDAGTFWMRFADFCEEFGTVEVSEYRAATGF